MGDQWTAGYLLPLYICLPFGVALAWDRARRMGKVIISVVLVAFLYANAAANYSILRDSPSPAPKANLAKALVEKGYRYGYADFWSAYTLTALSNEQLIIAPTGPNDRYPPYLEQVRSADQVFLLDPVAGEIGQKVTIKGIPYRIISREVLEGLSFAILNKSTEKSTMNIPL